MEVVMPRRKTHAEFLEQIKDRPFTPLDEYQTAHIKMRFRCNACGHIWSAVPNGVLSQKSGCPKCANKKKGQHKVLSHDDVVDRLAQKNITPLTRYTRRHVPMRFRCQKHGIEWECKPLSIFDGKRGCPECGKINIKKASRKYNRIIEDHGEWVKIDVSTPARPNKESCMDRRDFDIISGMSRICTDAKGYCVFTYEKRQTKVHRFVMDITNPEIDVDHRNHDTRDNRRSNLVRCTQSQNNMNMRLRKDNKTKHSGICFCEQRQKYVVQLSANNRRMFSGRFDTLEKAIAARDKAVREHHGEFAYNLEEDVTCQK